MPLLKLQNLGKIYSGSGSVAVGIRGVDLEFELGEFVAITGKSGSGKTTLLNCIAGIDSYEEGELFIDGEQTSHYSQSDWEGYRQDNISFIFQDYNIIDSFTVLQNVELALMDIESKKERRERALDLIAKVGLTEHINHKGSKLSGGQKQRTVIARALAKDSRIILADEPTGNLDSSTSREVIELLHQVSKDKLVIIVTHSFDEVEEFATREIRVFDGAVERDERLRPFDKPNNTSTIHKERTKKDLFRLGAELGRHRFFAMPKLSVFTCIIMMLAMLGSYFATALYASDGNIFGDAEAFNYSTGRLIVIRRDGKPMTDDEVKKLQSDTGANDSLHYDSILDYTYLTDFYDETYDRNISANFLFTYSDNSKPDIGRRPESENEAMLILPVSFMNIYGKDTLKKNTFPINSGLTTISVCGVKYYEDNTKDARIVLTYEGFEQCIKDRALFDNSSFINVSIQKPGVFDIMTSFYSGNGYSDYVVMIDDSLSDNEYYIRGDLFAKLYNEGNESVTDKIKGADIKLTFEYNESDHYDGNFDYGYRYDYDYATEKVGPGNQIKLDDLFEGGMKCRYDLCSSSYQTAPEEMTEYGYHSSVLYLSPKMSEKIFEERYEDDYSQCSLFFKSDRDAKKAIDGLKDDGYRAILSDVKYAKDSVTIIMEFLGVFLSICLWFLMIIFIGLFIALCTSRVIMSMRGDCAIMRSMGIKVSVIKLSSYIHMLISMIPALVMLFVIPKLIYSSPKLNYSVRYLHAPQYLIIIAGMFILCAILTNKYNKKLFKESVKKTLKGSDDIA